MRALRGRGNGSTVMICVVLTVLGMTASQAGAASSPSRRTTGPGTHDPSPGEFVIRQVIKDPAMGIVKLRVDFTGESAGKLRVTGRGVERIHKRQAPGVAVLELEPEADLLAELRQKSTIRVDVKIAYQPDYGPFETKSLNLGFRLSTAGRVSSLQGQGGGRDPWAEGSSSRHRRPRTGRGSP